MSTVGQACKATVLSNNKVRIADGIICVGGHFARIPYGDYIDCEIDSGQSEKKRNDIIVARFESTGTGGIDTYTCEVKKGTAGSTATDPEIVQEDLYKAGKVRELPLYRVKIEGLSITAVEQLFTLRKTNEELEKELESLNSKSGDVAQNNDTQQVYNLLGGALIIVGGTKKVTLSGSNDYIQLFTKAELRELFGSKFDPQRLTIITNNGDALITDVHLYEPEYWQSSGCYYQYYYPKIAGDCRINYLMVYRPA